MDTVGLLTEALVESRDSHLRTANFLVTRKVKNSLKMAFEALPK